MPANYEDKAAQKSKAVESNLNKLFKLLNEPNINVLFVRRCIKYTLCIKTYDSKGKKDSMCDVHVTLDKVNTVGQHNKEHLVSSIK